jgi:hypothetical protein
LERRQSPRLGLERAEKRRPPPAARYPLAASRGLLAARRWLAFRPPRLTVPAEICVRDP